MNKAWIATAAIVLLGLLFTVPWALPEPPAPLPEPDRRDAPAAVPAVGSPLPPTATADDELPTERAEAAVVEPSYELQVRVKDTLDQPVPDAKITLRHADAREPLSVHPVNAEGAWRGEVSGAEVLVSAAAEGVGSSVVLAVTAERAARGTITLLLARPVVVAGLVIDRQGNAIADDVVQVGVRALGDGCRLSAAAVRTDGHGRFTVEALAGDRLELSRQAEPDVQTWITAAAGADAVLAPHGMFQVLVRVVGPDGKPVAAELDFLPPGPRPPGIRDIAPEDPKHRTQTEQLTTGSFRLLLPRPAEIAFWLTAAGFAPVPVELPEPRWPHTENHVEVVMTPVLHSVVKVERNGASPPPDQDSPNYALEFVWLQPAPHRATAGAAALSPRAVYIGDDDCARTELPLGSEWFASVGDGAAVRCRAGDLDVVVRPATAMKLPPIELTVFLADGTRVDAPTLHCHDHDPVLDYAELSARQVLAIGADGNIGAYAGLLGMHGTLVVTDPATAQTAAIELQRFGPRHQRLVLQPPTELVVRVRNGGRPARGIQVEVSQLVRWHHQAVDRDGTAVFRIGQGHAQVRVLRGEEVLADRDVELGHQRLELELPVDL